MNDSTNGQFSFRMDPQRLLPGTDLSLLQKAKKNELLPAGFAWAPDSQEAGLSPRARTLRRMVAADVLETSPTGFEKVFNGDQRDRVAGSSMGSAPYSAICYISARFPCCGGQAGWRGSGGLIAPDVVLTAAHVIYCKFHGQRASSVTVMRAIDGGPANIKTSKQEWFHPSYAPSPHPRRYDYGLIRLQSAYSQGHFLGLGNYTDELFANRENYYIIGYPADKPSLTMWKHSRKSLSPGNHVLFYTIDTTEGQSGALIIDRVDINGDPRYLVVGVHSGAGQWNEGVRITDEVWSNIKTWL